MSNDKIVKQVFRVVQKEDLTPSFIRITLEGEGVKDLEICTIGVNNKIMIPPSNNHKVKLATWDNEKNEWVLPAEDERPTVRTYTHRGIDLAKSQIVIDFVNHGDNGPASAWARNAKPNDELGVAMKKTSISLYKTSDWYLLVGDATAVPVLSAILESLPDSSKGICIVEVPTVQDQPALATHTGFEFQWLYNQHPEKNSSIFDQVKQVKIPTGVSTFGYVACEYNSVKNIRQYFKSELGWSSQDFYAFSYWKSGTAEDKSTQIRHDENK